MHLNLGGIVKGITTGLETLVETGNPIAAAGAGAVACFSGGNCSGAQAPQLDPQFNPLFEEMRAENPFEQQNVNTLSDYADLIAA